ncbi:nitroreductase family protein [Clostridium saccharoperbutylacetonicum]|uniref:nitroreductase family protein n=1 Tax=Clostridium saccharoperbutylacetonicum TaxID=36745 RepID=UPI000983A76B|nr:nitroreductase family protein [Clostridium saccharoperbutylacetonicum]AQR94513.1 electron transport complex subunit RsxB [Clostridium saccharoperbutylacetonicum]NSB30348.1 nitroreductase/Pyruvate/2-oxoacid:ferredoxin oxidoreductase delta subunit [Clostridium saccharoperbutylacetonicum]
MNLITVNEEKCINCGLCINECSEGVLKMGSHGPEVIENTRCFACGHCTAICPNTAIDNKKSPLKDQIDLKDFPKLNEKQAEYFLRSRRSIRNYKTEPVSKEKLTKLIDIARFAPTAGNSQGLSFIVVQNRQLLEQALELSIQMLENSPLRPLVEESIKSYRKDGHDSVFRSAPNLIIATSDKDFPSGRNNAVSSLTYLELYAPSLGLGSCWAGLFEHCIGIENSPLLKLFNIAEDKKVVGAVMVGYPKYSYKRLVDRNPLDATFIE